jgi:hypothetical protein
MLATVDFDVDKEVHSTPGEELVACFCLFHVQVNTCGKLNAVLKGEIFKSLSSSVYVVFLIFPPVSFFSNSTNCYTIYLHNAYQVFKTPMALYVTHTLALKALHSDHRLYLCFIWFSQ